MIRAETTTPPLDTLAAATAGLTPDQRHVFFASLAGSLSVHATPEQWAFALVQAAERVREAGA
jgi:hypothetical protein